MRECLVIVNKWSGRFSALHLYESCMQRFLFDSGVVCHEMYKCRSDYETTLRRYLPVSNFIVIVGGDGTISSTINSICLSEYCESLNKPLVIVPAGMMNSIASSCKINCVEEAIAAIKKRTIQELPLWEVKINDNFVKYMCSYVAVGTFARVIRAMWQMRKFTEGTVRRNFSRANFALCACYSSLQHNVRPCSIELERSNRFISENSIDVAALHDENANDIHNSTYSMKTGMKMFLASQFPLQSSVCSLTPQVSVGSSTLDAVLVDETATRLRTWHLLSKESKCGEILQEDGVHTFNKISEVRLTWLPFTSNNTHRKDNKTWSQNERHNKMCNNVLHEPCSKMRDESQRNPLELLFNVREQHDIKEPETKHEKTRSELQMLEEVMAIDGELVKVLPNDTITIRKSPFHFSVMTNEFGDAGLVVMYFFR